ncbi:hypothetical protein [Natranaerofaba carboxydovora]|uniref:hypothetical protein n=1 Tax=Natranaerofaba carboxydovora TaxID=2742683 RepID=UPI001F149740|nr:hypothetical protein [Natranaerofaba carboxydovora]UMZ74490.1 hypothetical protein ACONDI_02082 [Natranaerofaba carboxydovora]
MEFEVYDVVLVPFVVGLIQVAKMLGFPKKASPILAIVIGNILSLIYLAPDEPAKAVLIGTAIGLAAVGTYSGTKNTLEM